MNRLGSALLIACSWIGAGCGDDGGKSPADGGPPDATIGDECAQPSDCEALGTPPCGGWACRNGFCDVLCDDCEDGDFDGYGVGAGCAGHDCDDDDDDVHPGHAEDCNGLDDNCDGAIDEPLPCYTGPEGTEGVGVCRAGLQTCIDGERGACSSQIVPSGESCNGLDDDCDGIADDGLTLTCGVGTCASAAECVDGAQAACVPEPPGVETCNGVDDDCDGAVDEDCEGPPPCVFVAPEPFGSDATGDGSATQPFETINAGIAAAVAGGLSQVCVAAGDTCPLSHVYDEDIVMVDGVSLYGGYEHTTWTRPPPPDACDTLIENQDADGVNFPDSVTAPTAIDGFAINAMSVTSGETAAVTIDGSTGAVVSNVNINNPGAEVEGETTYGVNVIGGATPLITMSRIHGGRGTTLAVGVRSAESAPIVAANCDDDDLVDSLCAGPCYGGGGPGGQSSFRGIRGHSTAGVGSAVGVLLEDSPGARISRSVICGGAGGEDTDTLIGIRIVGDADGTLVIGNSVAAQNSAEAHGIVLGPCDGAAPRIVANYRINGDAQSANRPSDGIRSMGDCHPVIERNGQAFGSVAGDFFSDELTAEPNGIHCGSEDGTASRCVVSGNLGVIGTIFSPVDGVPAVSTGIRCDDGACARVERNLVGTARSFFGGLQAQEGDRTYGILLGATDTLVDGNTVTGGCGISSSAGIRGENSSARIQNNFVVASPLDEPCAPVGDEYVGVEVVVSAGTNEVDLHSNNIFGAGADSTCDGSAIKLSASNDDEPEGPRGIFRNNVLQGGMCQASYGLFEAGESADPRLLENNDFWPADSTALYRDEDATDVTDIATVNGQPGAANNIAEDPGFVNFAETPPDLHLDTDSVCRDAGTAAGAPAWDFDGVERPQESEVDIGAFEFVP